jgi:hypothetical protein
MSMGYLEARTSIQKRLEDGEPFYFREIDKDTHTLIDPGYGKMNYLYCNRFT